MRAPLAVLAAGVLAVSLVAAAPPQRRCRVIVPGNAATATPPTRACEQHVYLDANGTWGRGRVGNVGAAAGASTTPTWDPEPPQEPFGPWAGAVSVSAAGPAGATESGGARFAGTFVGNLDTLAVELYLSAPGHQERVVLGTVGGDRLLHDQHTIPVSVSLEVDDTVYTWPGAEIVLYDPPQAPIGTFVGRFAITGLFDGRNRPRAPHALGLRIASDRPTKDEIIVLFDAAEVPSRIHFNRSDVTGYVRLPAQEAETTEAPGASAR